MFPQHVEVLTIIEITFLNILNLKKKSYSYTQLSDIFNASFRGSSSYG